MAAMTAPTNGSHQTLLVDSGTVLRKHYNPEKQRILDSTRLVPVEKPERGGSEEYDYLSQLFGDITSSTLFANADFYDIVTDVTSSFKPSGKYLAELLWYPKVKTELVDEDLLIDDDKLPSNPRSTRYVSATLKYVEAKPRLMPDPEPVWFD